jgi:hypothetical protein
MTSSAKQNNIICQLSGHQSLPNVLINDSPISLLGWSVFIWENIKRKI